jgi:putative membrane protein
MPKLFSFTALTVAALCVAPIVTAADLSSKDHKYITETAEGLMAEIQLGEMAEKQAQDERVKQFGKRMVEDHGKDLRELKQLAAQKKVTLPDSPNGGRRKEADKLGHLSRKAFDREYVKYEAKDHKKDVKDQRKEMKGTADPDLKKFATAAHETVLAHRKIVDDLETKIAK